MYQGSWAAADQGFPDNPLTEPVPYMHCPSNGNSRNPSPMFSYAGTSYRPSVGDGMWHNNEYYIYWGGSTYPDNARVHSRGAFTAIYWKGFGAFTDGLSNTVGMSEGCNGTAYDDPTVKAGAACGSDFSRPQAVSGESPYGVWGASGTPSGGESRSL